MNKKKSKALAFLLAASLLVPSANGIVSAAELRGSGVAAIEQAEGTTGSDATTGGETTESTTETVSSGKVDDLQTAVNKEGVTKVVISKDINFETNHITISKPIEIVGSSKEITLSGKYLFEVNSTGVKISNLTMNHSESDKDSGNLIYIGDNMETTIDSCNFKGEPVWNLISNTYNTSKLIFTNNNVNMKARAMIVGVTNGSRIVGNTINLLEEKYNEAGKRTGVLSVIANATTNKDDVIITGNTFENANRVIGVDNATISGDALKIKDNKFINTRFAFETDSRTEKKPDYDKELKNIGNSYDLSGNYYKYGGKVGPLRIEDASSKGSHLGEGNPTELKIEDKTPLNIVVGPYYTTEDKNESAHAGVATVNGKDYARLEKAIRAAEPRNTVKLVSDITVDTWNQIWNIKDITIDGAKSETENYKITVNSIVESKENHDAVLHSAGGNTFKNLTIDLSKVKEGKAQGIRAIDAGANDTIDNVTIKGGKDVSYGIVAGEGCGKLIVTNSNISNCGHGVYLEGAQNENVEIKNNTFDGCGYASILQPKNSIFEGNTVKGGKVNIMHKKSVVKGNTFESKDNTQSRVKFYDDGIKFEYNKIMDDNGTPGATLVFANDIDDKDSINRKIDPRSINLGNNYWGSKDPNLENIIKISENNLEDKDKGILQNIKNDINDKVERSMFKTESALDNALKPSTGGGGGAITPSYTHKEIIGSDRYDTAAKIADKLGSYDTVVLVNATSTMSDGLSAAGLAGKEDGAILLVKKDSIPKVTMDRIKKVKKVYIIGGESAISAKVANEITAANIKVERLGGKTRVETSKIVAEKLGNYKDAFVVNGFKGEADAMSASAVAAKNKAPILLTNGKESTHDKKSGVKYYVIGGNNVVDKSIADKYSAEVLAGKDRYATNREVIDEFYSGSDKLYLANGDKLVDALTASPLAKKDGIVLVNEKSDKNILKGKNTVQVGGMDFEIKFEK